MVWPPTQQLEVIASAEGVFGRIEELQGKLRQFACSAGRDMAEDLRTALRRLDSASHVLLAKAVAWIEGEGRTADSATRRSAYFLLAELQLQELDARRVGAHDRTCMEDAQSGKGRGR